MDQMDHIQEELRSLPVEKQAEVLDFILFLRQQIAKSRSHSERRSLRQHPAFGSWRNRHIDAVDYQHALRSEWDARV